MTSNSFIFLDNASTTRCSKAAAEIIQRYAETDFGNPSSAHRYGYEAARAIRDSRLHFGEVFSVAPEQVVFTGSGTEADNLAIQGIALNAVTHSGRKVSNEAGETAQRLPASPRVIASSIEHPAVLKSIQSLADFGLDVQLAPVDSQGQVILDKLLELVTPDTILVSIMRVNNIVGSILPVEELATACKHKNPNLIFHTDAIQAFGKVDVPKAPSPVDLVSISAHKIHGPKGVGALIILNRNLLKSGLRPLIWGGEQENGLRSGTQSAGLIAAFRYASEEALKSRESFLRHSRQLRERLREQLIRLELLGPGGQPDRLHWNSPDNAVPHIISLSAPHYPAGPLVKLLEERKCLVSTGSACGSLKPEPDPVLRMMGLSQHLFSSALRISFSAENQPGQIDSLAQALRESLDRMGQLLQPRGKRHVPAF